MNDGSRPVPFALHLSRPPPTPFEPNPAPRHLPVVPRPKTRMSRKRRWLIVGVSAGIVTLVVVAAVLTLRVPFHLTVTTEGCPDRGTNLTFPVYSMVSFHWAVAAGSGPVTLEVTDLLGTQVYVGQGSSGAGFFDVEAGPYDFNLTSCNPATVHVSGSYLLGGGVD
jgi:hypothetical protein